MYAISKKKELARLRELARMSKNFADKLADGRINPAEFSELRSNLTRYFKDGKKDNN